MPTPDALEAELDCLAARAGLTIPDDRRRAVLKTFAEVRAMTELLRTADLGPADEPSNVYAFDPILRGA